ncbi:hypothetical protein EVAR_69613_1 [Eumeta japonica]|uniref:Uncharacterized protein n=1 Tax=Eumeta variegata TaxID=151549 RepID=A0A4C2A5R4_EUMVA|nr:hypothetical protein EVAR_69613_1 [Eumeta japonica]
MNICVARRVQSPGADASLESSARVAAASLRLVVSQNIISYSDSSKSRHRDFDSNSFVPPQRGLGLTDRRRHRRDVNAQNRCFVHLSPVCSSWVKVLNHGTLQVKPFEIETLIRKEIRIESETESRIENGARIRIESETETEIENGTRGEN